MRIAIVNPISETPTSRRHAPAVESNRQSIGVQMGRALGSLGHDPVVLMAEDYAPRISDEGVKCIYFPTRYRSVMPPGIAPCPVGFAGLLRSLGADLVICSELFQPSTVFAIRARSQTQITAVWQELGDYQDFLLTLPARAYYHTVGRRVLADVDVVLPRSERARDFMRRLGATDLQMGPEIPNGADEAVFRLDGDSERRPVIVCPGSLVDQKNPLLVLDAFLKCVRPALPHAVLLFKGRGPLESEIRARAATENAQGCVIVDTARSSHERMAEAYGTAACGVVASSGKGSSLSPVELAMCGTRVVMNASLYHSDQLSGLGAAAIAQPESSSLGEAMLLELTRAPSYEQRRTFSRRVSKHFGTRAIASRLLEHVEEVRQGRTRG